MSADMALANATPFWKLETEVAECGGLHGAYFSVCGILYLVLCSARRSTMQQSLEICACLKLNQKVLCVLGLLMSSVLQSDSRNSAVLF